MLLGRSVTNSVERFDRELDCYFDSSRKYRCKLRTGSVLIVDPKNNLSKFLEYMVEQCGLKVSVVKSVDVKSAKALIKEMGSKELKAVIIDTSMVDVKANGNSLPSWMDKNFPNVPMWVSNCEPERVEAVKSLSRAGILENDHPISDYVDILGLPSEAHELAEKFVS